MPPGYGTERGRAHTLLGVIVERYFPTLTAEETCDEPSTFSAASEARSRASRVSPFLATIRDDNQSWRGYSAFPVWCFAEAHGYAIQACPPNDSWTKFKPASRRERQSGTPIAATNECARKRRDAVIYRTCAAMSFAIACSS
jgi:hypothetical protein